MPVACSACARLLIIEVGQAQLAGEDPVATARRLGWLVDRRLGRLRRLESSAGATRAGTDTMGRLPERGGHAGMPDPIRVFLVDDQGGPPGGLIALLDPALAPRALERLRNPPTPDKKLAALTANERQVPDLIGAGLTCRQIAGTHLARGP